MTLGTLASLLSVDTVMVMIGDYPLSWIEFSGTILYFASVWLIARKKLLTWPVGIVSVLLYGILFWQIRLYSDCMEQVYYFFISIWGWVSWKRAKDREQAIPSGFSKPRSVAAWALATFALGMGLGFVATKINGWLPSLFPQPASYPYLDALSTVASFVAMYLLARRKAESWVYWILVDIAGVWLYWVKDVRFIAFQYVILLGMAAWGLLRWAKDERRVSHGP